MIYLDYAATSPALPEVFASMAPFLKENFGNASSAHEAGRRAWEAVEKARKETAALIGADPSEIYFTSGGTESDNWALFGTCRKVMEKHQRFCLITTAFEHEAVLETARALQRLGAKVMLLSPDREGYIPVSSVESALQEALRQGYRQEEILVSVMTANNELGTIQPVAEIGALCHARGVLFHTDAVQAVGHVPMDVRTLSVDLLSASAHKFGGPKGTGFLYVRKRAEPAPLLYGGGQEKGLRSGTYHAAGIVGLGTAARLAEERLSSQTLYVKSLRDAFRERVLREIPGTKVNGPRSSSEARQVLPGHLNIAFEGVESVSLLLLLDTAGVAASGASACASFRDAASHVLLSIGLSEEEASSSLRFSFGPENTEEEMSEAFEILKTSVEKLRKLRFG